MKNFNNRYFCKNIHRYFTDISDISDISVKSNYRYIRVYRYFDPWAKCLPRAYFELIRSDISGSLGSKSSRLATLRPSPPSVMNFSHDRPPVVKPTTGELQDRVETLSRRSRSVKRKPLDSLKRGHPA